MVTLFAMGDVPSEARGIPQPLDRRRIMRRTILSLSVTVLVALSPLSDAQSDPTYDRVPVPVTSGTVNSIDVNDFDADGNLDVAAVGLLPPRDLVVSFGDGNGAFTDSVTLTEGYYDRVTSGFVNGDEYPDVIAMRWYTGKLAVFLSNGDGTFETAIEVAGASLHMNSVVTGYINDDAYLDVLCTGDTVAWFSGDGSGGLTFESFLLDFRDATGGGVLDLNDDGLNDIVLVGGLRSPAPHVWFFVNDGQGSYSATDSLEVGAPFPSQLSPGHTIIDFDEDGNPDILMVEPVPAVNGDSHARIIMTDGTGHIKNQEVIVVEGTCYGLTAFDYNDDNHLDIAAASTSERRLYFHLGDGSGGIVDSLSVSSDPVQITCLMMADFREDGMWDAATGDVGTEASLFLRADPPPMSLEGGAMTTTTGNDIGLRVRNPRALFVDDLRYHVPGARCDLRDTDGDGVLEKRITDLNVQDGAYRVSVWGTPATLGASTFSLPIEILGQPFVLARDATPPLVGDTINFAVYVGAGVMPPSGSTAGAMPTFDWSNVVSTKRGATDYGIQISDSWDFTSPLYDVNDLTVPHFTPPAELSVETVYYWRFRTGDGTTWDDYSDIHAVTISSCTCPHQMDYDTDGFLTPLDLMNLIDVLFVGQYGWPDPGCPTDRLDFDNDGFQTALDLGLMIDHLFAGGPPPCDPCNPYQESCE